MNTVAPIYMERINAKRRMARFYAIRVERTLFGDWAVIYQWGRIGSRGQHKEIWMAAWTDVVQTISHKLKQKNARGYARQGESA